MAIKFWNFILVTTFLITMLRGGSNFFGNFFSTLPISFFIWVGYRFARLQPWWPFDTAEDSASRFGAVAKLLSSANRMAKELKTNETSNSELRTTIQQMAQQSLASRSQKTKIVVKKASKPVFNPVVHRFDGPPVKEPEAFRVLSETVSTVGVRTKAVRAKVVRQKAVRSKRTKGLL